ncbi:MAG: DUF3991 domain-containing protein [Erysipelotrichaceae bacterium]|nr:DUF3991 domain-containing protein [Erysipelotrichaceae bacterium]
MSIKIYSQDEKQKLRSMTREARKISCAEIADNVYGLTLYRSKKSDRYLRCYEHPSMVFDLKNNLVFHGAKTGGMGPYDFISFYENMSLQQAREKLNEYYRQRDPRSLQLYHYNQKTNETYIHQGLLLPRKSEDLESIIQNLSKYHISENVVDNLVEEGMLYCSESGHLVMVGYDKDSLPAFAVMYGLDDKPFKVECQGSHTKIGFLKKNEESKNLVICSSPMDAMTYMAIDPNSNVLAPLDKQHLIETIMYNLQNDLVPHGCNVHFVIGNDDKSKILFEEFEKRYRKYSSEAIRNVSNVDPSKIIKAYIYQNSGIKTTANYDQTRYTNLKDLLDQAEQIKQTLTVTLEDAVEATVVETTAEELTS